MLSDQEIISACKDAIELVIDLPAASISNDMTLRGDINLSSMEFIEVVIAIQDRCLTIITDEEMEKLSTFGDLVQLVAKKQNGSA